MVVVQSYPWRWSCVLSRCSAGLVGQYPEAASREWRFQLFYWDYALGVFLLALVLALTMGSFGATGRPFLADLAQADASAMGSAFLGARCSTWVTFCWLRRLTLPAWRSRFPSGLGWPWLSESCDLRRSSHRPCRALVSGRRRDYRRHRSGRGCLSKTPVRRAENNAQGHHPVRRVGLLLGVFYPSWLAPCRSTLPTSSRETRPLFRDRYRLSRYSALKFPVEQHRHGQAVRRRAVPFGDYFRKGSPWLHAIGILGGLIWCWVFTEHRCFRSRGYAILTALDRAQRW